MNALVPAPILIPLFTGAICLLFWKSRKMQQLFSFIGTAKLFLAGLLLLRKVFSSGIQVMPMGSWRAPFGITLAVDLFSAMMVVVTGLIALAVCLYSLEMVDSKRQSFGFHPLFHFMLMGVCGAFVTGDLFNMYVWFELLLIASFVLMAHGGEKPQLEAAIKYVALNLISSGLFLTALGLLYGLAGTLNMADLSVVLRSTPHRGLVTTLSMLLLASFGIKAAIFPLFFWLPASYHTPPAAVSAIFAGLLTKVGVYALMRVFTLLFVQDIGFTHTLILFLAGLTMLTGVLGAVAQNDFRRILSFHIISQIGYMIMGLGLFTQKAIQGSIFYIVHHIIVKTNLFLVSGVAYQRQGSYELKHLGGLYREAPALAFLFAVPAFSLAGMPPLSGFFAKFALVKEGLSIGQYTIVAVALLVGMLTLFSMTKIWANAFWKPFEGERRCEQKSFGVAFGAITLLSLTTLAIGLFAEPVFQLAGAAARQLIHPEAYLRAVLGG